MVGETTPESDGARVLPAPPPPPMRLPAPPSPPASLPAPPSPPAPLPAPPRSVDEVVDADVEDSPRKTVPRKRILIIGALLVAAVVVVGGVVFAIQQLTAEPGTAQQPVASEQGASPTDVVNQYISALASGNAASANELLPPRASDASLLTDDVLQDADQRIVALAAETLEESSDRATVRATMSLNGEQFDHVFTLSRASESSDWSLAEPLVTTVRVSAEEPFELRIGDDTVVAPASTEHTVYLYPGLYRIGGSAGEYLTVSEDRLWVSVPSSEPTRVGLAVQVGDEQQLRAAVLAQVQARVDLCTQVPGNMDPECPAITRNTKLSELQVVDQPEGFSSFTLTGFESMPATIAVRDVATAGVPNPQLRTERFTMRGSIVVESGEPQIVDVYAR